MKKITFLLLFISQISFSQSQAIATVMEEIVWEQDSILSVYKYMTDNMAFSPSKSKRKTGGKNAKPRKGKKKGKSSKPKTAQEKADMQLKRIAKRKKGNGKEFAMLFDALVSSMGYETLIVDGYSKNNSSKNPYSAHSWNAVKVNGSWQLYDAALGAGSIVNRKFVRQYDESWYQASPTDMIAKNMPFDPLWQMLATPISYRDFNSSETGGTGTAAADMGALNAYYKLDRKSQMQQQLDRSLALSGTNDIIEAYQNLMAEDIEWYDYETNESLIKETALTYNEAEVLYKEYKTAKKKKFVGKQFSRKKSKEILETLNGQLNGALDIYEAMEVEDPKIQKNLKGEMDYCYNLLEKVEKELEYMDNLKSLKMDLNNR